MKKRSVSGETNMSLKPKKGLDGMNKRRLMNKRTYPVRWDSKFEIPALRTLLLGRDFFMCFEF